MSNELWELFAEDRNGQLLVLDKMWLVLILQISL